MSFLEIYNDNIVYNLKHEGPVSKRAALNMAIDYYRHHVSDRRKVDLLETHYNVTDHGWMQIEFRDFIEVLIKKLNEEETKILIVLLKLYQLDVYAGTDLFDEVDFYNEVIISEDFIKIAADNRPVSKLAIATLCGMVPSKTDTNNRRYLKSLKSLKRHIEQMGVTVFDVFGSTASIAFTSASSSNDHYNARVTPVKSSTEKDTVFQLTQSSVAS